MKKQQVILTKKKLALAMSLAIAGTITGCSSGGGGGGGDNTSSGDSVFTILMNGGFAGFLNPARGGNGGEIAVSNNGASGGLDIKEKGVAKTSFKTPVKPEDPNLGSAPLAITATTTLRGVDDDNPLANGAGALTVGDLYLGADDVIRQSAAGGAANFVNDAELATGSGYLRRSDRTIGIVDTATAATHSTATGLSVAAGVTLTMGDNNGGSTNVKVVNDIQNEGTIMRAPGGGGLTLSANTYFGGNITNAGDEDNENAGRISVRTATGVNNNGVINASGFDEADEVGGNGAEVSLNAGGYVLNNGAIDTTGGDGSGVGGRGGSVSIFAAYSENNAAINSYGGSNLSADPFVAGGGGDGGEVIIRSQFGTNNSADINTSGGMGSNDAVGNDDNLNFSSIDGDGGTVRLSTFKNGAVKNSGNSTLSGGVGVEGDGGRGGLFILNASGGDALNSGNVVSTGGDTTDNTSNGGKGGNINIAGFDGGETAIPPGDVIVSGNLNVNGGNAVASATSSGNGGEAGNISITLDMDDLYDDQRIALLGYMSIDGHGGDGSIGGNATSSSRFTASSKENDVEQEFTVGSVFNDVAFNARGGNSTAVAPSFGDGGDGGRVQYITSTNDGIDEQEAKVENTAAISLNGGATSGAVNGTDGGDGGRFTMRSYHGSDNSGAITAIGGAGGEEGGNGGDVTIDTVTKDAENTGDIILTGGNGAEEGGDGGEVSLTGEKTENKGDITANGGNATDAGILDSEGGDGGNVVVTGDTLDSGKNSGAVTLTGGNGADNGDAGCLQVGITFEGDCS